MKPSRRPDREDDLLPEYDFSGAIRGNYYQRYRQGTNVVLLDADVAAVFRDSATVNDTLRRLLALAAAQTGADAKRRPSKLRQPRRRRRPGGASRRVTATRG
jgi:hypothetical protein